MRRAVVLIVDLETQLSSSESQLPHRLPVMHVVERLRQGAPGLLDGHSLGRTIDDLNLVGAPDAHHGDDRRPQGGEVKARSVHAFSLREKSRASAHSFALRCHTRYLSLPAEAAVA